MKKWIKSNLLTRNNKFNNRVCFESWWHRRNYTIELEKIQTLTSFLDKDASITERSYCIYNAIYTKQLCYCGNSKTFIGFESGYRLYCSVVCATQSEERNQKIGANRDMIAINEKVKKTNLKKYGVEHAFQSDKCKRKAKQTKLLRYGDENYNNKQKSIQTCLKKYGTEYSSQAKEVIEKIQEAKNIKLPELRSADWILEQNKTKNLPQIAKELGVTTRTVYLWCLKHGIDFETHIQNTSTIENELFDFIVSLNIENPKKNDRNAITPKELDVYLPQKKIAFELNGVYWHAEDRTRHINKLNLCKNAGIRLIQVWDHEWINSKDIIKSIIKNALGICDKKYYARHCEIRPVDNVEYKEFLAQNHIQGYVASSIRYGLYHKEELISVMGIGKSRFSKKHSHELLRFCSRVNTHIVGGFSKLLTHVLKNHTEIISMQTFCDLRLFNGNSYEKSGFVHETNTKPGYFYYKSGMILQRQSAQKHKLKTLLGEDQYDSSLSESQNMANDRWLKVWDCGQGSYSLKRN